MFVILDQDVLCECMPTATNHFILVLQIMMTLVVVYYSFNLEYEHNHKHLFTFFEEHVLGIVPK